MSSPGDVRTVAEQVRVDRVRCSGHGVCARLLPSAITLDEWGYPVVGPSREAARDVATAVRLCPAQALHLPPDSAGR